ncbi:MAG: transcriptional repressor [Patescibacteria group bacterium]|nr:transcriptional repressor [Patescibacteria group bacterium]
MKRSTPVRNKILKLLRVCKYPLSVPEINKKVKANKTTIYRQIESMIKEGILFKFDFGDGVVRYESASNGHHHHLICNNCGEIEGVVLDDDLTREEKLIFEKRNFLVTSHMLEFFGFCKNCQSDTKS